MSPEEGIQGENTDSASAASPKGAVVFADKIEIFPDKGLAMFNVGPNKAYRAIARDKSGTPLIALVCERSMAVRTSATPVYKSIINPNLLQLIEYGTIFWPPARQERLVFFYLQNVGQPLLIDGAPPALGMRPDDVINMIVRPVVNALQDLRDKDFVHGNIRPSNMFDNGVQGKGTQVVLGDCLSTSVSFMQPALYETIPRGMANPLARGKGLISDDLYALGVSLAVALRQNDSLQGLSDQDIVKSKITHGSYAALASKDRFKSEIIELLRGLLHDDAVQRWTVDDILLWLDGQRLGAKQAIHIKKPPRPMSFGAEKFLSLPLLALAVENNVNEAKKIIEDDSLNQWLERSVQDDEVSERFQKALSKIRQTGIGHGYEDKLASNVSIALDPVAPLRYKNCRILGEGIGAALLEAMETKKSLSAYSEIISAGLLSNWLEVQSSAAYDISALHNKFELCKRYLRSNKIGEGIERCLYVLCPDSHCLSEKIQYFYVSKPDDLLRAFETLCQKNETPETFIDRHIAAFLFQKDSKLMDTFSFDLNTGEQYRIVLATLKCLANIQKRYKVENVPGVTKALSAMLPVLFQRFHDRSAREKIEKAVLAVSDFGDIQKILTFLDNKELLNQDHSLFRQAMKDYAQLDAERLNLEQQLEKKDRFALESGREWAAIVSCVIAGIFIVFTALSALS